MPAIEDETHGKTAGVAEDFKRTRLQPEYAEGRNCEPGNCHEERQGIIVTESCREGEDDKEDANRKEETAHHRPQESFHEVTSPRRRLIIACDRPTFPHGCKDRG